MGRDLLERLPLGLHHFYEAFSIEGKANLRQDALAQFGLMDAEPTSDLRLCKANTENN